MSRDQAEHAARARWDLEVYRPRSGGGSRSIRDSDTISVIVPPADDEAALVDTLESLRMQSHGALEIIVAVRGDDERVLGLGERMALRDPRVQLVAIDDEIEVTADLLDRLVRLGHGHTFAVTWPGEVSCVHRFDRALATLHSSAGLAAGSAAVVTRRPVAGRTNTDGVLRAWAARSGHETTPAIDIVSRTMLNRVGGFVSGAPGALEEMCARAVLAGVPETEWSDLPGSVRVRAASPHGSDWAELHDEIGVGRRSPYVPLAPKGISLRLVSVDEVDIAPQATKPPSPQPLP